MEPWDSRFSQSKQGAVKVSSVISFNAAVHKRGTGSDQWEPVRVRCGYDEGMMLAYELLDANGQHVAQIDLPLDPHSAYGRESWPMS